MAKIADVNRLYNQPGESIFTISDPTCQDETAKGIPDCKTIDQWDISALPKDPNTQLPAEFSFD